MQALIVDGKVAALAEEISVVPGQCALVIQDVPGDVGIGWGWSPEGFTAPHASADLSEEEAASLSITADMVTIGQAEMLYEAATAEAKSDIGGGPATVLVQLLDL